MRRYITLFVFACGLARADAQPAGAASPTNSAMCIEYFGEATAPVIPIVVSDSTIGAERGRKEALAQTNLHVDIVRVSIVEPRVMAELLAEFKNLPSQGQTWPSEEVLRRPYMVFHIVVLTSSGDSLKILDGRQTDAFLKSIESHCRKGTLLDNVKKLRNWVEE